MRQPTPTSLCSHCNAAALVGSDLTPAGQASLAQARAALADPTRERVWWLLGFYDDEHDPPRWLGIAFVDAPDEFDAPLLRSHDLRANPGGEVRIHGPVPAATMDRRVPELSRRRWLFYEDELLALGFRSAPRSDF